MTIGHDGTVNFIDPYIREYLTATYRGLFDGLSTIKYQEAEELLGWSCCICLKGQVLYQFRQHQYQERLIRERDPLNQLYNSPGAIRFIEYAKDHWMQHCRSSETESPYLAGTMQEYLQCSLSTRFCANWNKNGHSNAPQRMDIRNAIFRECARYGFTELCTIYVEMGADLDERDEASGLPPLAMALNNQHWTTAAMLIERGASLGCDHGPDAEKTNFLHHASACGRNDIVEFLLRHGADPNAMTITSETPLHLAATLDQSEVIESLLRAGGDVNRATKLTQERPVHFAAKLNCKQALQRLLESADVMAQSSEGWTALHYAAAYGHQQIVEILISRGAEIDAETYSSGTTPLVLASKYGHESVTSTLLSSLLDRSCLPSPNTLSMLYQSGLDSNPSPSSRALGLNIDGRDQMDIFLRPSTTIAYPHKMI